MRNETFLNLAARLVAGEELTSEQTEFLSCCIQDEMNRIANREKEKIERQLKTYQLYLDEIREIFNARPNTPLTATEIQLLFPETFNNRISVQRISHMLKILRKAGEISSDIVKLYGDTYKTAHVWFVGEPEFEMELHDLAGREIKTFNRDFDFWYRMQNIK